ncbi:unnamed protein product [Dicrocoelium dendriticum]|nr:unnamed protein product [Dicrocoelium dendriticum]
MDRHFTTPAVWLLIVLTSCNLALGNVNVIPSGSLNMFEFNDILEGANPAVLFFIPSECVSCDAYEELLAKLDSDQLYSGEIHRSDASVVPGFPLTEPPLIAFADSVRRLPYCGPLKSSDLMDSIQQFSAGVRAARLNDANFEHDTQASTGSTTGDWLIIFDAITESTLQLYDGLCLSLRARGVNLGVIDPSHSIRTSKRFNVTLLPSGHITVLMLHRSELYRYNEPIKRTMTDRLLRFGLGGYKSYQKSVIPRPRMRFDEALDFLVDVYVGLESQYDSRLVFLAAVFTLLATIAVLMTVLLACFRFARGSPSTSSDSGDYARITDTTPSDATEFDHKPKSE